MSGVTAIAFTMYPVTDVARAFAFYRDKLGLRQEGMNEAWWVEFDVGGATFGVGDVPDNGTPGSAQSLILEVDDMKSFRALLTQRGVESSEPHHTPYDCSISKVQDPDGNTVWLHQKQRLNTNS